MGKIIETLLLGSVLANLGVEKAWPIENIDLQMFHFNVKVELVISKSFSLPCIFIQLLKFDFFLNYQPTLWREVLDHLNKFVIRTFFLDGLINNGLAVYVVPWQEP